MTDHYRIGKFIRSSPLLEFCLECEKIHMDGEWVEYDGKIPYTAMDKCIFYRCCSCHNGGEE